MIANENVTHRLSRLAKVLVACMGEPAREAALKLTAALRQAGLSAVMATGERSQKSQLRQADTLGVRYTVIIGEEEVKNSIVTLKDMSGKPQQTVPSDKLVGLLNNQD